MSTRFLSNAKVFSYALSGSSRRGYSAGSQAPAAVSESVRSGMNMISKSKKGSEDSLMKAPWVPDPKTGFYRPENHTEEMDIAELREMLLKNNARKN